MSVRAGLVSCAYWTLEQLLVLLSSFYLLSTGSHVGAAGSSCDERLLLHLLDLVLVLSAAATFALCRACAATADGGLLNLLVDLCPWELHLPGHHFAGPGTDLGRRLRRDLRRWRSSSRPVNAVDRAAFRHDVAYLRAGADHAARARADLALLDEVELLLARRKGVTKGELFSAAVVWLAMSFKCAFGNS